MAISTYTDSNYSPLFKRVWGEYADNLYGNGSEDPALSQVNKTFNFKGSQMNFPVKVSFGGGKGQGSLPVANAAKYVDVTLTRKKTYARLNLDRETIVASKGREGAFKEATSEETTAKLASFMHGEAMNFWNDGTGILGQQSGNATGTAAAPVLTAIATGTYKFRANFFEEGDYINIRQSGTTLLSSLWEIMEVNTTTRAITLARITGADDLTAIGAGTHDIILQGSLNAAPMGMKGVVEFASGSLYGVAFQRRWKSYALNAQSGGVNAPISVDHLNRLAIQIQTISGEYPTHFFGSPTQYEKMLNRLGDNVRYTDMISKGNKMTTKALVSFNGIELQTVAGSIGFLPSRYIEDDRVYAVNFNHIEDRHAEKFGWFDEDGTVLLRMQDQDAYEARYGGYKETFINPLFQGYAYNFSTT